MKKYGPRRILETKFLYCNKHGETDYVLSGTKSPKWKCCKCIVDYSTEYRKKKKMKAVNYKGGECESCGYKKSIIALTFHHREPLFKEFELSGTGLCKSWDKLVKELDKCQLLCVNCHYELHENEDKVRMQSNAREPTKYHKKLIHEINSRKLGKYASP
jgi:5-methylcytosine-specific restriction endonuclease McrA